MIPRFIPKIGLKELITLLLPASKKSINEFEKSFASKMNQKHAVAFPYGRTAQISILESLKLKGKEIICPSYTCVVVAHAIIKSGNYPLFVDSTPNDFNMDLDEAEKLITENTGAIIATSIFGYPLNLNKLSEIKKKYPHLYIIQDCAHSFSAEFNNKEVQKEGIAAFYGLNISKILTTIFGGIVTTDSDELYQALIKYRDKNIFPSTLIKSLYQRLYLFLVYFAFKEYFYSIVNYLDRKGFLGSLSKYYEENVIDMPEDYRSMMTPVGAKIGLIQLEKYESFIKERREVASFYNKELVGLSDLTLPPIIEGATYSHYVVRVKDRDTVLSEAIKHNIQLGWLIEYSIPDMNAYANYSRPCPNSSMFKNQTINLPLSSKHQKRVVNFLKSYFGEKNCKN